MPPRHHKTQLNTPKYYAAKTSRVPGQVDAPASRGLLTRGYKAARSRSDPGPAHMGPCSAHACTLCTHASALCTCAKSRCPPPGRTEAAVGGGGRMWPAGLALTWGAGQRRRGGGGCRGWRAGGSSEPSCGRAAAAAWPARAAGSARAPARGQRPCGPAAGRGIRKK